METRTDPRHIAIIMDGNGRWAEKHGLARAEGHYEGAKRVVDLMTKLKSLQTEYLTLYAFSTENWKRSKEEVDTLMRLLADFLDEKLDEMCREKIRLLVTGRLSGLPDFCVDRLQNVMNETSRNFKRTLILALNYGGRVEILDSVRKIAEQVHQGVLDPSAITEETIAQNLYHPEIPDPDLMIRTSGEMRISNFLLWELSYSEFYFTNTLWPDFTGEDLDKAIEEYNQRHRRFGGRP